MPRLLVLCCAAVGIVISANAQTPANSVVRFRLSYGSTFFGNIDVELFDSDKPITVTNFLRYVQSGAYDRSILQRCIPGFVLQGGEHTVPNPYSSAAFEIVQRVPTNAPITNEFFVGTLRSNVFGTIAMAKVDGDPNSANSAWFFNLGNNSTNLDVQNGGFTVFGRVKAGLNVLKYFNTISRNNGYIDQLDFTYGFFCPPVTRFPELETIGFDTLPVGFLGFDCVQYNDLFTVQTIMLNGPDVTPPRVTIISPKADANIMDDTLTVSGTASDNVGVASVRVLFGTNSPVTATGSNSWTAIISNVPPGTGAFTVEAIDAAGYPGHATRQFFRRVQVPLSLSFDPAGGTVAGATDGQLLDLTRSYKLTAKAKPGYLFDGWTGSVFSAERSVQFVMETNTALTAIFVTNLFPWVKGTYNGLFYDTNRSQVELESSGFFTLTLGSFGTYSAKILKDGKTYPVRGTFDVDGRTVNFVERRGTNQLTVRMSVDLTNGTDVLSGSVSNFHRWVIGTTTNESNVTIDIYDTNQWSAALLADRAVFNARTFPAPQSGGYTALIAADASSSAGPPGESFGKVTMDASGRVTLSGTLADTTKATQKVSLSKSNQWPLYVPLYRGKGALLSWVSFDPTQTETDLGGALSWIKQSQPTARYYRDGFTNDTQIAGSAYVSPVPPDQILDLTTGLVAFTGGNLATDFTNSVTLGADGKVINGSTNKLVLSIQKSSGLMTGSVTPPDQTRSLPFKGAVLQKQNRAGGFIPGTNETGRVDFTAE